MIRLHLLPVIELFQFLTTWELRQLASARMRMGKVLRGG